MNQDLQRLAALINGSDWLANDDHEPRVGDFECPELVQKYAVRGQSIYTPLVTKKGSGFYGCIYGPCYAFFTTNLEDAIRHLRHHHFGHSPFVCIPPNGGTWYVSHCPLLYSLPHTRRKTNLALTYSDCRFPAQIDLTNHQHSAH
jgi:hypothetical protein